MTRSEKDTTISVMTKLTAREYNNTKITSHTKFKVTIRNPSGRKKIVRNFLKVFLAQCESDWLQRAEY